MLSDFVLFAVIIPLLTGGIAVYFNNNFSSLPIVATVPPLTILLTHSSVRGLPSFPPQLAGEWLFYGIILALPYPYIHVRNQNIPFIKYLFPIVLLGILALPGYSMAPGNVILTLLFMIAASVTIFLTRDIPHTEPNLLSITLFLVTTGSSLIISLEASFVIGQILFSILCSLIPFLAYRFINGSFFSYEVFLSWFSLFAVVLLYTALITDLSVASLFLFIVAPIIIGPINWWFPDQLVLVKHLTGILILSVLIAGSFYLSDYKPSGILDSVDNHANNGEKTQYGKPYEKN